MPLMNIFNGTNQNFCPELPSSYLAIKSVTYAHAPHVIHFVVPTAGQKLEHAQPDAAGQRLAPGRDHPLL